MIKFTPQESLNLAGSFVASALVSILAFIAWALVFREIPARNDNSLTLLIGILSSNIGLVVGFFFGSSLNNKKQTEAIADMAKTAQANTVPGSLSIPAGDSAKVTATDAGIEIKPDP